MCILIFYLIFGVACSFAIWLKAGKSTYELFPLQVPLALAPTSLPMKTLKFEP